MERIEFNIAGITCMGCLSSLEKVFYSSDSINKVEIAQDTGKTVVEGDNLPTKTELQKLVESAGSYNIEGFASNDSKQSKISTYKPLILVALYLVLTTVALEFASGMFLWETWMPNFMAGFFLVFSFFKFLDLKGFAKAYKTYDFLAKAIPGYAFAFPFIEAGLGFAYLFYSDLPITHLVTAIIMFVSLAGVVNSVLRKNEIKCACLGTVFNLPMSYVTIIEDGIMLFMAVVMYLKFI